MRLIALSSTSRRPALKRLFLTPPAPYRTSVGSHSQLVDQR